MSSKLPPHVTPLDEMDAAWREASAGARLEAVRRAAPRLRARVLASGQAACVRTFPTASFPYPTRFGLGGVARSPLPYTLLTNRVNVVQFETDRGDIKTLLFNPTDYERAA